MRINFNKIICINLKSVNTQQLFAICETYFIGFEVLFKSKSMGIDMKWITEDRQTIAYVVNGYFYMNDDFSISKEDQEKIKTIKPLKTPKMPKTELAVNNYKAYLAEGYDIRTPSMDSKLLFFEARREEARQGKYKEVKKELPVVLETDAILDKIGKYGIDSISEEERNYLDNKNDNIKDQVNIITDCLEQNFDPKIEIQILNEVIDKLSKQQSKMYTEEEVKELLETQRGNSYVAVLYHTKNDDIATVALEAPEPAGGKWVKSK